MFSAFGALCFFRFNGQEHCGMQALHALNWRATESLIPQVLMVSMDLSHAFALSEQAPASHQFYFSLIFLPTSSCHPGKMSLANFSGLCTSCRRVNCLVRVCLCAVEQLLVCDKSVATQLHVCVCVSVCVSVSVCLCVCV